MDIYAFKNELILALKNNTDLAQWLAGHYGNAHVIYDGLDERDIPRGDNLPAIIILIPNKVVGHAVNTKNYQLQIVCMLEDSEKTET